ncbi:MULTISPECIES: tRNA pseudouridine(38-40) synthase TruA [unclassified Bacillus (in: firmicutes)]|uniref:tRNA pseudouridine(38-40) synthase TruA n=1 Tax=unclassified Bacillus (in: firmicutes) TaxID=185979 RepID=UPI000BF01E16|nr:MULTISPECIES: tRNA pseudouridine(38-40) synthase TruA [unclassified Bacillus (in: firmicutes)]PEJ47450.1 tRNA pseudouridine(38-40) synthase TruA [Bacillus sp. AFS002410]PEL08304.1 tRNA pseudouridine(38-40) synthase TruA [Bacillus sp. AFS017336]
MNRIKCIISYDGTLFSGYQVQPNQRTIQTDIETVLTKMHKGNPIKIHASGRTDTGVHAVGQVIHFDSEFNLLPEAWKRALNAQLPKDIYIKSVEIVDDKFHSRFDVVRKEYRYFIWNEKDENIFSRNQHYFFPFELDIVKMQEALNCLLGTHDFSSFCASNTDIKEKVRTIYKGTINKSEQGIVIALEGNGFLYNMVRIIVGTLIEVGQGKRDVISVKNALLACDRAKAGKTSPPNGLFLWKVDYNN